MATITGNYIEDWEIRFAARETEDIADAASATGAICAFISG